MSPGEILRVPDTEVSFEEDDRSAATKVKTAIAWLERANFVLRGENRTRTSSKASQPCAIWMQRGAVWRNSTST